MSSDTEQIKSRLGIAQIVGSYIKLEKAGTNFKARCPFHNERTASFFVSPARDTFHCFGCDKGGDIFTFVQEIEGVPFSEALRILAERAGVTISLHRSDENDTRSHLRQILVEAVRFYQTKLKSNPVASNYLMERGLSDESAARFNLGYASSDWNGLLNHLRQKNFKDNDLRESGLFIEGSRGLYDRFRDRIMFPIYDYTGLIVGFTGRVLPLSGEKESKYINTPETLLYHKSRVVYGLNLAKTAIRRSSKVILVEGQMDVILSFQAGVENIVAVSGTSFTEDHLKIISRLADTIVIVLDADSAGFKASSKATQMALAGGLMVAVVAISGGKDPADIVRRAPKEWQALAEKTTSFIDYALAMLSDQTSNKKEKEKLIREHIYPYITLIPQALSVDDALQKIAQYLMASPDATRDDFLRWRKNYQATDKPKEDTARKETSSRKEKIIERLAGIIFWQKKTDPNVSQDIEKKVKDAIGEIPKSFTDGDKLAFEAEAYYTGKHISHEADILLSHLQRELLNEKLTETLERVRQAEAAGDTSLVSELLQICQELNHQINTLIKGH